MLSASDLEDVSKDEPQLLVEMVNVARARAEQIGEDQRLAELKARSPSQILPLHAAPILLSPSPLPKPRAPLARDSPT